MKFWPFSICPYMCYHKNTHTKGAWNESLKISLFLFIWELERAG